jgi:hypothetical protein
MLELNSSIKLGGELPIATRVRAQLVNADKSEKWNRNVALPSIHYLNNKEAGNLYRK